MRTYIIVSLVALSSTLQAGWIMQATQTDTGQPPQTQTILLDPRGLRLESPETIIIFRAAEKKFILAEPASKTYQILDRDYFSKMAQSIHTSMQQMESALAQMPPEQRAMMSQMMGNLPQTPSTPPISSPATPVYKKMADGIAIGPWKTAHYEVLENQIKQSEIWLAPPNEIPISHDLIKLYDELEAFMKEMTAALPMAASARNPSWKLELDGPGAPLGLPVKQVTYQNDSPIHTWELTRAEKADLQDSHFSIPAGYTLIPNPPLPE